MYPTTVPELWVATVSMMAGASLFVVMVGMMSSLILSMDQAGSAYTSKIDVWKQYFAYRRVPKELRTRVMHFFEHRWHTRKVFDEAALLEEISGSLRTELYMHVCSDLLDNVPLFKICSASAVMALVPCLRPLSVPRGEFIYAMGEMGDEMFFIASGHVEIVGEDGVVITNLGDGSYFGEFSFLFDEVKTRTASAVSTILTQLYALKRDDFVRISQIFPEIKQLMRFIAAERRIRNTKEVEERDSQASDVMERRSTSFNGDPASLPPHMRITGEENPLVPGPKSSSQATSRQSSQSSS